MNLTDYSKAFCSLNVNRADGRVSPHKPCMLLAVTEMFELGKYPANRIRFDDVLLTRYADYFGIVKTKRDRPNPWLPFFHLRSEGFWHLTALPHREQALEMMISATRRGDITENVAYACLDDELFTLLSDLQARNLLRKDLIGRWFPDFERRLKQQIVISDCEKEMVNDEPPTYEAPDGFARSRAFRNLVLEAYDFRCAASGWRVVSPDYAVLVQAAHIVPFRETQDDRPQNGISLCPNFHWAMDRNIIAPGPDFKWHVSPRLDDRISDNQPLLDLKGQDLLLPRNEKFYPDSESLQWRMSQLN